MPLRGQKLPVAWYMLVHRKGRLVLSMLGIAFSVVIMFMEIGFFNGINDSQARLASLLNADLIILHKGRYSLLESDRLNRARMQQALACDGVTAAAPLYEGAQIMLNPETGMVRAINVLAFPPGTVPLKVPGLAELSPKLAVKGTAIFDRLSRDIYGRIAPGTAVTIGESPFTIVGLVDLGPSIRSDGTILMGDVSWIESKDEADLVSMALLTVRPGTDLAALKTRIAARIGDEALLFTPEELRQREVDFTARATPVGGVFAVGVLIGFIIGVIICYQILFNEITDNMPQYATVKAIGFSQGYLVGLVLKQALWLSLVGFLPGLLGGMLLYAFIEGTTGILMFMTSGRALLVLSLAVVMCVCSGLLAVRKVLKADPADVF